MEWTWGGLQLILFCGQKIKGLDLWHWSFTPKSHHFEVRVEKHIEGDRVAAVVYCVGFSFIHKPLNLSVTLQVCIVPSWHNMMWCDVVSRDRAPADDHLEASDDDETFAAYYLDDVITSSSSTSSRHWWRWYDVRQAQQTSRQRARAICARQDRDGKTTSRESYQGEWYIDIISSNARLYSTVFITRGWALDKVHNSSQPLDHLA